jgi:hypothetical protein
VRRKARGDADAILLKKQAEAQGLFEVLTKQAQGLEQIVKAAGDNSRDAVLLLIVDKLPELVRLQTEAIKNIKIDKLTVWEGGSARMAKLLPQILYQACTRPYLRYRKYLIWPAWNSPITFVERQLRN